jgi:DNA-binding beta-propeller fold protein YncE
MSPYGIAVAPNGHVWVANYGCGESVVWRFNPQTLAWSKAYTDNTPRGLAAGVDGFIYVANDSASRVAKVDPQTMKTVAYANLGEGRGTMGVGIDAQGFVWAINGSGGNGTGTASKINPADMSVVADPYVGGGPYSYSDMTGYALKTVVAPEGTYSHIFTGWTSDETRWLHVSVSTVTNGSGKVELRYRVAGTLGALEGSPWTVASGSIPDTTSIFNLDGGAPVVGKHLQVEVKLVSAAGYSPRVQTLAVVSAVMP